MPRNKTRSIRLNIYVHDAMIRRQVKAAAARNDTSISEYCLRAITDQLIKEKELFHEEGLGILKSATQKARAFHARTFGKHVLKVSSVDLIGEARESRDTG